MMMLGYMDQDTVWYTKDSRAVQIREMDPEWRYNCLKMLERGARSLSIAYSFEAMLSPFLPQGEMAQDAFDNWLTWIVQCPLEWIRSTQLHRALDTGLPQNPYKRWRLAQRARHYSTCPRRAHNGPRWYCNCQTPH